MTFTVRGAVCCEKGLPANNEDNFFLSGGYKSLEQADLPVLAEGPAATCGVFAVCDGMGGADDGELAAAMVMAELASCAAELLRTREDPNTALRFIHRASRAVFHHGLRHGTRMGAVLVLAIVADGTADIYNVGDSRAYLFSQNALAQLSRDHTVGQSMREIGIQEDEKLRHQLTQNLGMDEEEFSLEPYHCKVALPQGGTLLLCSDGVTDMLTDENLTAYLAEELPPLKTAELLVRRALAAGGRDNVTAMLVHTG